MFNLLKKKLNDSIKKLSGKAKEAKEKQSKEKASLEDITEKIKKSTEEIKKELEHIVEEQETGDLEHKEESKEEVIEELPEEEQESLKEPTIEQEAVEPKEKIEEELHIEQPDKKKKGLRQKLFKRITAKKLTEDDIEDFFSEMEPELLSANVAIEVVDFIKVEIKKQLIGHEASRMKTDEWIRNAFENALVKILDYQLVDWNTLIKNSKEKNKPAVIIFLGFNGSGKTTSIAKLANYLSAKGYKAVLAAGDTFRAAAIDQLETHGERIGVKVIKHQYGSDSAAVIFDAIKHAESKGADIVLADTAGRTHTNTNLIDELKKVVRVNKPDLKILVIDGLTGNDAVEQAKQFNSEIGVDAVIITKVDVDEKGGAVLSVSYTLKKPIIFLGIGQAYEDFKEFNAREFVKDLLE